MKRILFVGGATGGHLQPAVAIATALQEECALEPHFLVGDRAIEARVLQDRGFATHPVPVVSKRGAGFWRSRRAVSDVFEDLDPAGVVGLGGSASVLVGWSAWRRGIPLFLHEQNRVVGKANRWLLPFARRLFLSYPDTRRGGWFGWYPLQKNVVRLGCPVRSGFCPSPLVTEPFTVLVLGGSQGAESVNNVVAGALPQLAGQRDTIRFVHLAGPDKTADLEQRYREHGIDAQVFDYVDDPAQLFAEASLVVARSGGSTVAEIAAVGRPAVFFPYPHHRDRQQFLNGGALVERNAALILPEDPGALAAEILELANDRERLQQMSHNARSLATPNSARRIGEVIATHLETAPVGRIESTGRLVA